MKTLSIIILFCALHINSEAQISFGTAGTNTAGTNAAIVVPMPASLAAGDIIILTATTKHIAPGSTVTGFIHLGTVGGGLGSSAVADEGPVFNSVWYRIATGSDASATISGQNNAIVGRAYRFTKNATKAWSITVSSAVDATAGTAWSLTADAGFVVASGDHLIITGGVNGNPFTGASATISGTGATFGSVSTRQGATTNNGNDLTDYVHSTAVTAGTSTAALTFGMAFGGSATNFPTGAGYFIRLREVTPSTRKIIIIN